MSTFFEKPNPHKILNLMQVCAFILGAYLTSPAPSGYTLAFWAVPCLISMAWASWSFAGLDRPRRAYNHDLFAILSILAWGAASFADYMQANSLLATLLRTASIGFLGVFVAIFLFTCQLIIHLRYRGRHKPPSPAVPEQPLLGL